MVPGQCNVADVPTTAWVIPGRTSTAPDKLLQIECSPAEGMHNTAPAALELIAILDINCPNKQ